MAKAVLLFDYAKYERIRNYMGLSNYRVAKDAGLNFATISEWKSGKYEPRYETARKIAKALGCDVSEFFREEEDNG